MVLMNKTEISHDKETEVISLTRLIDGKLYEALLKPKSVRHFFVLISAFETYSNEEFKAEAKCLSK